MTEDNRRGRRATERALCVDPTFDLDSILKGQHLAEEIARERSGGSDVKHDSRPSIGNAVAALANQTDEQLRQYIANRQSK